MTDLFYTVLHLSGCGLVAALAVGLILMLFYRTRCSKTALLLLWAVAAFRLLCPWSPASPVSLFNWTSLDQYASQAVDTMDHVYSGDAQRAVDAEHWSREDYERAVSAGVEPVQNPTTGLTPQNEPTPIVSIEKVCEAIGVRRVHIVDPNDLEAVEALLRQETAADEPSVIITRRPCALLKGVQHHPPFQIDRDKCRSCKMCLRIGCPAIRMADGKAEVDETLCVGCGLCKGLCAFDAIREGVQ